MSYIRWAEDGSDVYVYASDDDEGKDIWVCCGCVASDPPGEYDFVAVTREGMIVHLMQHRKAGDTVPRKPFERLYNEIVDKASPK